MEGEPFPRGSLVLLVGPPAAGKSTLAAALVAVGLVDARDVLAADRYRARLAGDAADLRADRRVWPLLRLHLQERLALGHTTVVDATNLAAPKRARHIRVAHAMGQPVVAIRLDVPVEELVARNLRRRRSVPEGPLLDLAATAATVDDETLLAEGVDEVLSVEELFRRQPAIGLAAAAVSAMPPAAGDAPVL
jgi:predicted kinase